jgi:site-specific recombinase XerC
MAGAGGAGGRGAVQAFGQTEHLAALRMLLDWLVIGHVIESNPAHAVRGPKYSQKKGKTPVLDREEARALIAAIDTSSPTGLRDRALIGVMIYIFARVGAVLNMKVVDYFGQGRRGWVRLNEKCGKEPIFEATPRSLAGRGGIGISSNIRKSPSGRVCKPSVTNRKQ